MTGVCREHILSSFEPSCIAFERKEAEVLPVFEQEEKDIQDRWVVTQIQRGALDFADDFIRSLGDYCTKIPIKPAEVSLPYEGFLRFASDTDIKIFSASFFEDEVWGGAKRINIAEFIKGQYEELNRTNHFPNAEVIVKQVVSDGWVMTIKRKLKRFPVLYKAARNIYTIVEKTD